MHKRNQLKNRPPCPDCKNPMGKAGKRWSGRHQVQKWVCSKCGRSKTTKIEKEGK
jgi:transposase-like protein